MCQMTLYLGNSGVSLWELAQVSAMGAQEGKDVKHGNTRQNQQCAPGGVQQVLGESEVEKDGGSEDEEGGNDGIAPGAVGTLGYFLAFFGGGAAEDKDGAGRDHIEEPLRENGQREELAEGTADQ